MKWTTDLPTVEGEYWLKAVPPNTWPTAPIIVNVFQPSWRNAKLHVTGVDHEGCEPQLSHYAEKNPSMWAGPLEPPSDD